MLQNIFNVEMKITRAENPCYFDNQVLLNIGVLMLISLHALRTEYSLY